MPRGAREGFPGTRCGSQPQGCVLGRQAREPMEEHICGRMFFNFKKII